MDSANLVPSSGTLISAVLETVGLYYQSYLLDVFGSAFHGTLGALALLVGILSVLAVFILTGQPKYAAWLLFGPGLYMSVVGFRTEVGGVEWMFGRWEREQERVDSMVQLVVGTDMAEPRVSSVFAYYDKLISQLVRETVRVLVRERETLDTEFIVREQLFSIVASPTLEASGLRELVHASLVTQCGQYIKLGKDLVDVSLPDEVRCGVNGQGGLADLYDAEANRAHMLTVNAREYVMMLIRENPSMLDNVNVTEVTPTCASGILREHCTQRDQIEVHDALMQFETCYRGQAGGVTDYIRRLCESAANRAAAAAPVNSAEVVDQAGQDPLDPDQERRIQKFINRGFRCHEIWSLVYAGLHREAMNVFRRGAQKIEELGLTRGEDLSDLCNAGQAPNSIISGFVPLTGQDDPVEIVRFIAKNILKNEMAHSPSQAVAALMAGRGETVKEVGVAKEDGLSVSERQATLRREHEHRMGLMVAAAKLPYIQGLVLYWLAVVFPFFALLLLVPGKHVGFLLWFAFWVWAKSWDIGFAVVYLLGDVLYSMFSLGSLAVEPDSLHGLAPDAAVAAFALREMDPTFQLATFYAILSVAVMSIPTVMGYLLLHGFSGGIGLLTAGIGRAISGQFGPVGGIATSAARAAEQPKMLGYRMRNTDRQAIRSAGALTSAEAGAVPGYSSKDSGLFVSRESEQLRDNVNPRAYGRTSIAGEALGGALDGVFGFSEQRAQRATERNGGNEPYHPDGRSEKAKRNMDFFESMAQSLNSSSSVVSGMPEKFGGVQRQQLINLANVTTSDYNNSSPGKWDTQQQARSYGIPVPGAEALGGQDVAGLQVEETHKAVWAVTTAFDNIVSGAKSFFSDQGKRKKP